MAAAAPVAEVRCLSCRLGRASHKPPREQKCGARTHDSGPPTHHQQCAHRPGTQRFVDQGSGTTPGLAAEAYAAVKAAKYADHDNFISFILETGGRVNKAARDWLDALTAPEPGEQVPSQDDLPWNPQTRTTTETVIREAMQALVRVQAHMLARIVVEIRSADLAVELEP